MNSHSTKQELAMRAIIHAVVLASLACAPFFAARAEAQTTTEAGHVEDRKAIEDIVRAQDDAWNRGDAQAYVARLLPDATCTNIVGIYYVGRDAFADNMRGLFTGIFKGSLNQQTLQNIRFIEPNVAVVDTISTLSGMARVPMGGEAVDGVMRSRPEQVMVKRADGWWVLSFHNVTMNPKFLPKELTSH